MCSIGLGRVVLRLCAVCSVFSSELAAALLIVLLSCSLEKRRATVVYSLYIVSVVSFFLYVVLLFWFVPWVGRGDAFGHSPLAHPRYVIKLSGD